jgi:hypothetical protein
MTTIMMITIPILVTLVGTVTDVNEKHDLKALLPILVTLVGITIDTSDVHPENADAASRCDDDICDHDIY